MAISCVICSSFNNIWGSYVYARVYWRGWVSTYWIFDDPLYNVCLVEGYYPRINVSRPSYYNSPSWTQIWDGFIHRVGNYVLPCIFLGIFSLKFSTNN